MERLIYRGAPMLVGAVVFSRDQYIYKRPEHTQVWANAAVQAACFGPKLTNLLQRMEEFLNQTLKWFPSLVSILVSSVQFLTSQASGD